MWFQNLNFNTNTALFCCRNWMRLLCRRLDNQLVVAVPRKVLNYHRFNPRIDMSAGMIEEQ
ncbi:hypothetical protein Pint_22585 [Pistacia integerrima]|uniref:Uncharacterized protein n=1 Tax=Pistacia integerrima TaxID=434235 RepID=A0ACC0YLE8_9ROSI|nr:hypothetical protein Pint_22585 [Pistacia integerrima]